MLGLKELSRKIDAIYDMLCNSGSTGTAVHRGISSSGREAELESAIGKAIEGLEKTKSSFKSRQIMEIREELLRAIGRKA